MDRKQTLSCCTNWPGGTVALRDKRIKCNEPPTFTGSPMDIRLWIIDLNDFFNLQLIKGPDTQASTACTCLGSKIETRTQLMRLSGHRETFEDWVLLQAWLLENYSVGDVGLDAELKLREKKTILEVLAVLNKQVFETQLSGTMSEHLLHGVRSPDKAIHNGTDIPNLYSGTIGVRRVRHFCYLKATSSTADWGRTEQLLWR